MDGGYPPILVTTRRHYKGISLLKREDLHRIPSASSCPCPMFLAHSVRPSSAPAWRGRGRPLTDPWPVSCLKPRSYGSATCSAVDANRSAPSAPEEERVAGSPLGCVSGRARASLAHR